DKEIEWIYHFEVGKKIDSDRELARALRDHESRKPISERILLPVYKVLLGRDLERITRNPGTTVRRRAQPDDLRPEPDRPVVAVPGDMMETDQNRHRIYACTPPSPLRLGRSVPRFEFGTGFSRISTAALTRLAA